MEDTNSSPYKKAIFDEMWETVQNKLTDREFDILKRIYVNNDSKADVSRDFGITETRIGQIHDIAIRKLKCPTTQLRSFIEGY